uniref:Uncharacterized protein n=1 Tax=Triticum urartu TaxID=4572 RepID=A0A8R7QRH0_TRIUA
RGVGARDWGGLQRSGLGSHSLFRENISLLSLIPLLFSVSPPPPLPLPLGRLISSASTTSSSRVSSSHLAAAGSPPLPLILPFSSAVSSPLLLRRLFLCLRAQQEEPGSQLHHTTVGEGELQREHAESYPLDPAGPDPHGSVNDTPGDPAGVGVPTSSLWYSLFSNPFFQISLLLFLMYSLFDEQRGTNQDGSTLSTPLLCCHGRALAQRPPPFSWWKMTMANSQVQPVGRRKWQGQQEKSLLLVLLHHCIPRYSSSSSLACFEKKRWKVEVGT